MGSIKRFATAKLMDGFTEFESVLFSNMDIDEC